MHSCIPGSTEEPACSSPAEPPFTVVKLLAVGREKWRHCLVVIAAFALTFIVAALLLPKQYQVEMVLLPPADSSVKKFTVPTFLSQYNKQFIFELDQEKIYQRFLDNLRGHGLRRLFFDASDHFAKFREDADELELVERFASHFNDLLSVEYQEGQRGDTRFITVSFHGGDPWWAAEVLNAYVAFVDQATQGQLQEAVLVGAGDALAGIDSKIAAARSAAEKKRMDTITRLNEELRIAEQLNIIEPAEVSFSAYSQHISAQTGVVENQAETPGYLKGSRLLRAELAAVTARKDNDPYLPGLQPLLEERLYLQGLLAVDFQGASTARVDKSAVPPQNHHSPSLPLYTFVGTAFGVVFALLFLCTLLLARKIREEYRQT